MLKLLQDAPAAKCTADYFFGTVDKYLDTRVNSIIMKHLYNIAVWTVHFIDTSEPGRLPLSGQRQGSSENFNSLFLNNIYLSWAHSFLPGSRPGTALAIDPTRNPMPGGAK